MLTALVSLPALAGLLAFFIASDRWRHGLLLATASIHALLTAVTCFHPPAPVFSGWLTLDALGQLFLSITSGLFLLAALYTVGYLAREPHHPRADFQENIAFSNAPQAVFTGCLLLFLATMTWMALCHNFGLLWAALEASTLVSAPLIYFHRHHRSLEAAWKYIMICSVGIALALIGIFLLALAAARPEGETVSLVIIDLLEQGPELKLPYLKAAFLFFLVGYGTKMGLAPLHTWLPDAHSEAPSVVSALLSGALLNCAFLAILRAFQVCQAAGLTAFCQTLFLGFGLLSMVVAAVFILGQTDFKRMLAYSSVEHMGILMLGVGLGGTAVAGAMLHALNHSLTKAMLFLVAGNILALYQSKTVSAVSGLLQSHRLSGLLWLAGLFAITGLPPFGAFQSEMAILQGATARHAAVGIAFLALLSLVFIGMSRIMLDMSQGEKPPLQPAAPLSTDWLLHFPPAVLALATLGLGLYLPPALQQLLQAAARALGGS